MPMPYDTEAAFREVPVDLLLQDDWRKDVLVRTRRDVRLAGHRVPVGFVSDGASVPRALWWLFPKIGRYLLAAIVHDHALREGLGWTRSNDLFSDALEELDIVGWRHRLMVAGVRLNATFQHLKHRLGLGGNHVE